MDSDLIHDLDSDMILDLNYVLIFDISIYVRNMFYWGVLLEEDYLEAHRLCAQGLTCRLLGFVLRALLFVTGLYGSREPTHFVRDGWGHPKYFSETKAHCPLPPEISVGSLLNIKKSVNVRKQKGNIYLSVSACSSASSGSSVLLSFPKLTLLLTFSVGHSGGPNVTSRIGSGYPYRFLMMSQDQLRTKLSGNRSEVDTVAYHLSVLRDMFPRGINVLSLFSGIGGAEVALYRLNIPLKTDVQEPNDDRFEQLMSIFGGFNLVVGGIPWTLIDGWGK
ncbi:hypothetical protein F3Y22_tig00116959pilonHSYRG00232 [Hibiscus syriacus]|uniref:SAM-dependent MTase DRM-type domain-containing protein n=1 Tax=Hibiscus syriacus TaxID=106335 RepID=A0A6A2WLP7_HIBSY|nr:hypothetical protein F3Y22_tig00116959pilonHSYRG00232 [Hibiscus syriacus]